VEFVFSVLSVVCYLGLLLGASYQICMKSCLRSRLTNDMCAELSCHNRAQAKN